MSPIDLAPRPGEARRIQGFQTPASILGEDPSTSDPAATRHWVRIYLELVHFKSDVLERTLRVTAGMSPDVQAYTRGVEIPFLEDQLRQVQERLDYWQRRHLVLGGIHLDPATRKLSYAGRSASLTTREAELASFLLAHTGQFFSAETLVSSAWGDPELTPEQVRIYVLRLRRKLLPLDLPARLLTSRGRGYALIV